MKRNILQLDQKESPWKHFLQEFFEDTNSALNFFHESSPAGACLDRIRHDLVFVNAELASPGLLQKLNVLRQSSPDFRVFELSPNGKKSSGFRFDDFFHDTSSLHNFQKQLLQHLPLAEKIRVLVVDDEAEIGAMVRDFFDGRNQPAFDVAYVDNGEKGLKAIEKNRPDVVILDIKMPVMDGREVYREIRTRKWNIPVIIFFDSISGDEMIEIHKYGRPAVVEKGARQSAMPEMLSLVKKMAYFG